MHKKQPQPTVGSCSVSSPAAKSTGAGGTAAASDSATNGQRFPEQMLKLRSLGNTEVRNGLCCIKYRSEMDPRWPEPQFIDDSYVDRNRLDSLNLQRLNPDIQERTVVKCLCTRPVRLTEDWYVQIYDGTVICQTCARCFRCRKSSSLVARRLNSIDGFVLCNNCMLSYGKFREFKSHIRVLPMENSLERLEAAALGKQQSAERTKNSSNAAENSEANVPNEANRQEVLTKPRFRNDGRRPLRKIFYPDPRGPNHNRPDYRLEPPPYLAVDRVTGPLTCPYCLKQVSVMGMTVPSCARVFHKQSIQCVACQRQLHSGYQLPHVKFDVCSCREKPQIWCTKPSCQRARLTHHQEANCQLEPLHPGGRG